MASPMRHVHMYASVGGQTGALLHSGTCLGVWRGGVASVLRVSAVARHAVRA